MPILSQFNVGCATYNNAYVYFSINVQRSWIAGEHALTDLEIAAVTLRQALDGDSFV